MLIKIISPFKSWFTVDQRILGIYRIFLGLLIFVDIFRRWDTRHIFYSANGVYPSSSSASVYKSFSLLHTFNSTWEINLFFIIGMFFSILLIIGYKTKLSHLISAIILISLHNRVILVENAGDFVLNCMVVWTFFLPLGSAISLDSLKNSLKTLNDSNTDDLNNELASSIPNNHCSIAYFAVLFQISAIYFFTGLNKTGADWMSGTAVYYFYELDTFLTPFGAFLRDYVDATFSAVATYGTLALELSVPLLILFPLYTKYIRLIAVLSLTIFHIIIMSSLSIGLFSQTMIISFILLIDGQLLNNIKQYLQNRFSKKYILFYDSDCGFCHYTARIIKRLDAFNQFTFANQHYNSEKPQGFNQLIQKTAIVYEPESKQSWIKHEAFSKIISQLPFGFIVSWIFYIPGLNILFEKTYDLIANKRTSVSQFFGLAACGVDNKLSANAILETPSISKYQIWTQRVKYTLNSIVVLILLLASINYNLVANESVNDYMEKYGFDKFRYTKTFRQMMSYPRMIQRWNMFSPTVLKKDQWLIVEATLSDGSVIDPFTGKEPILNSLEYEVLWTDINQFWRKYFTRIAKNKKHIKNFEKWLLRKNDYFKETIGDRRIKSVKLWSLNHRNSPIDSQNKYKVFKRLLNEKKRPLKKVPPKKK